MRRWVLVLLLCVMPFQMVWASAAPYCAHESSALAKKHFGHHEHKHLASGEVVSVTDATGDSGGIYHADCESCHLATCAFMPAMSPVLAEPPKADFTRFQTPRYSSHIPPGLQRPDRAHPTLAARFGGVVTAAHIG